MAASHVLHGGWGCGSVKPAEQLSQFTHAPTSRAINRQRLWSELCLERQPMNTTAAGELQKLTISDAWLLVGPVFRDNRGAFEVFWEQPDLAAAGLRFAPSNAHHSYNHKAGTIRAFHLQRPPHGQAKLVSCVSGRTWDVVLDLRPESPTFRKWDAVELSSACGKAVYIPAGCAHVFATLEDNTTIAYLIEGGYRPESAAVVRWNDPVLGINWPVSDPIISDKDRQAPHLDSYLRNLNPELET